MAAKLTEVVYLFSLSSSRPPSTAQPLRFTSTRPRRVSPSSQLGAVHRSQKGSLGSLKSAEAPTPLKCLGFVSTKPLCAAICCYIPNMGSLSRYSNRDKVTFVCIFICADIFVSMSVHARWIRHIQSGLVGYIPVDSIIVLDSSVLCCCGRFPSDGSRHHVMGWEALSHG